MLRPTYATVNLSRISDNISAIKKTLKPKTKIMAIVKANAYGHGLVPVSIEAVKAGADFLGIAIPEEGIELRNAGITAPILVLGGIRPQSAADVIQYGLRQTVFSAEVVEALAQKAKELNTTAYVHIKVDTGMNRIGVVSMDELEALLQTIKKHNNVVLEGMCTHFAVSEIEDKSFTQKQAEKFLIYVRRVRELGFNPILHAANSGALLDLPQLHFDMVRPGLAIYGYYPGEYSKRDIPIKPALEFCTTVMHVKTIRAGDTVSYGRAYTAQKDTVVATLPVGYGDGYKFCMSGNAKVIINGYKVPVIGRICMDQCMADVTGVPDIKPGDKCILLGESNGVSIDAEEMAGWANTISYEILLSISDRVPRVYL